jgi:hypothetical protein
MSGATRAVVVSLGLDTAEALDRLPDTERRLARDPQEARDALAHADTGVLIVGPAFPRDRTHDLLRTLATPAIVVGVGDAADTFQEAVENDRLFYLSRGLLNAADLRALVLSALARRLRSDDGQPASGASVSGVSNSGAVPDGVLELCTRLQRARTLGECESLVCKAIAHVLGADRAQCLFYDASEDALWSHDRDALDERRHTPSSGLTGFAARTAQGVHVARAGLDPRYDADADDPGGDGSVYLLAQPVPSVGPGVAGVITAVRRARAAPFSPDDAGHLSLLASCAAPAIAAIRLRDQLEAAVADEQQILPDGRRLYRGEALRQYLRQQELERPMLLTPPRWIRRSPWALVALFVAALLALVLADPLGWGPRGRESILFSIAPSLKHVLAR